MSYNIWNNNSINKVSLSAYCSSRSLSPYCWSGTFTLCISHAWEYLVVVQFQTVHGSGSMWAWLILNTIAIPCSVSYKNNKILFYVWHITYIQAESSMTTLHAITTLFIYWRSITSFFCSITQHLSTGAVQLLAILADNSSCLYTIIKK